MKTIWNFLVGVWVNICIFTKDVLGPTSRSHQRIARIAGVMLALSASLITSVIIAVIFHLTWLLFATGMTAGITMLFCYWFGNGIAGAVSGAGSQGPKKIQDVSAKLSEEIHKVFRPFLVIGLVILFVVYWISINGWSCLNPTVMFPVISAVAVLGTLGVYFCDKRKWPGRVILVLTVGSAILWYVRMSPDPIARTINSYSQLLKAENDEANVVREGSAVTRIGAVREKILVAYQLKGNSPIEDSTWNPLEIGQTVQVMNADQKPRVIDGQAFVQIRLPYDSTGRFINGHKCWVSPTQLIYGKDVTVVKDQYVLTKKSVGRVKVWTLFFLTDKPVAIQNLPVGKQRMFFGQNKVSWNNPHNGNMAPISLGGWGPIEYPTMQLQAETGASVDLNISKL